MKVLRGELDQLPARIAEREVLMTQAEASTALAKGQLSDLNDSMRKASAQAAYEQLEVQRLVADDSLAESLRPNLLLQQGANVWMADRIVKVITLKNIGKRPVSVKVRASADFSKFSPRALGEIQGNVCRGGRIGPGEAHIL